MLKLFGEAVCTNKISLKIFAKLTLAVTTIVGLLAIASRELVPALTLAQLLVYCVIFLAGVFALLTMASIFSFQTSQFSLCRGGTDAQRIRFSSEPKGLVALRENR